MKKTKAFAIPTLALAFSLMLSACGGQTTTPDASGDAEQGGAASAEGRGTATLTAGQIPTADDISINDGETIKIGYLAQNETDQFCVLMGEAIVDEVAKFDGKVELEMSDAQGQAAIQVSQAEDMVTKQCDAVIISAIDQEACAPAAQKIVDAGIPCIVLNTLLSNTDACTAYVGVDDTEAGEVAVQIVSDLLGGEGVINLLQGQLGHPANENRMTGVEAALKDHPGMSVGTTQAADWDRNKAMNVAEDWIASGAKIDAVIAMNDEMAISAANAFQAAGLTDIKIVGVDALQEALEMIEAGKMHGTVFQDADGQGRAALDVAVCAALGVEVEKEYYIPFEPVTPDNYKDYMNVNVNG